MIVNGYTWAVEAFESAWRVKAMDTVRSSVAPEVYLEAKRAELEDQGWDFSDPQAQRLTLHIWSKSGRRKPRRRAR